MVKVSVHFSHSFVSHAMQPHGLQHARPPCPSNTQSLLKLMAIGSVIPSNHLILCCPLLLSPSIFPSIRVFSNESAPHIKWTKYWRFSFNISPSNEYSGLISLGWNGWFLQSKRLTKVTKVQRINSSVLSFPYRPTLTSIHDHWKNHSFDYMDLWWQSNACAF